MSDLRTFLSHVVLRAWPERKIEEEFDFPGVAEVAADGDTVLVSVFEPATGKLAVSQVNVARLTGPNSVAEEVDRAVREAAGLLEPMVRHPATGEPIPVDSVAGRFWLASRRKAQRDRARRRWLADASPLARALERLNDVWIETETQRSDTLLDWLLHPWPRPDALDRWLAEDGPLPEVEEALLGNSSVVSTFRRTAV